MRCGKGPGEMGSGGRRGRAHHNKVVRPVKLRGAGPAALRRRARPPPLQVGAGLII